MNHFSKSGSCCHGNQETSHHPEGQCCGHPSGNRHFYSQEEIIKHLEEYLQQLQAEAKGVEEHISKLKAGN